MSDNIYCTLFNHSYLDKGLVLVDSLEKYAKDYKLYIFAMDQKTYDVLSDINNKNVIPLNVIDLEDEQLKNIKKERSFAEYCWTWTPLSIKYVLEKCNEQICTYIDADMYFYSDPSILIDEMRNDNCDVLIVEHRFPSYETNLIKEVGRFCVEFNTFINNENGMKTLNKWCDDCINECSYNKGEKTHGDQMYLEEWPDLYSWVHILNNVGGGVAPWNTMRYVFSKENNKFNVYDKETSVENELVFVHFQNIRYLPFGFVNINLYKKDRFLKKNIYKVYVYELYKKRQMLKKQYGIKFSMKKSTYKNPILKFIQNYIMPFKIRHLSNIIRQRGR